MTSVGPLIYVGHMFETSATHDPAGFLSAVTEQLAKLPSQLGVSGARGRAHGQ